jgi:hypothetical protein
MRRCYLAATCLLLLLGFAAPARANWFCGVMDPYPGYGHPSFYFPPAMASFYAGYGYASLVPGAGYAPTIPTPAYTVSYQTYTVTCYRAAYVPCPGGGCAGPGSYVMVPYLATVTVPVYVPCP